MEGSGSSVPCGDELLAFAEAALSGDAASTTTARDAVTAAMGDAAMVDAAAIIANFQRMVRIADSSGIALDEPVLMMTQGIREDLGINEFGAATNSPPLPLGKRLVGRVLTPFMPFLLKRLAASRTSNDV